MAKYRRAFLLLFIALGLWAGDCLQRWRYVQGARLPITRRGSQVPGQYAVLVAGPGLDGAEEATGMRDLCAADEALFKTYGPRLTTAVLGPQSSNADFGQALACCPPVYDLVVYLSGHGGGQNFGCGRLNLTGENLRQQLQSHPQDCLVVVDCCWSGQFLQTLAPLPKIRVVTSSDGAHEAPFPSSFLSPHSFGRDFWEAFAASPGADLQGVVAGINKRRGWLAFLYPASMTTQGQVSEARP